MVENQLSAKLHKEGTASPLGKEIYGVKYKVGAGARTFWALIIISCFTRMLVVEQ